MKPSRRAKNPSQHDHVILQTFPARLSVQWRKLPSAKVVVKSEQTRNLLIVPTASYDRTLDRTCLKRGLVTNLSKMRPTQIACYARRRLKFVGPSRHTELSSHRERVRVKRSLCSKLNRAVLICRLLVEFGAMVRTMQNGFAPENSQSCSEGPE